jgi:hypothetical protein
MRDDCNGSSYVLHHAPLRCQLCRNSGFYLKKSTGECLQCPDFWERLIVQVGWAALCCCLVAGCLALLWHPLGQRLAVVRSARRSFAWSATYLVRIGFRVKLKILFSFYGIVAVSAAL